MKVEITEHQIQAIKNMADDYISTLGGMDDEVEKVFRKNIGLVNRFFKKNGIEECYFPNNR